MNVECARRPALLLVFAFAVLSAPALLRAQETPPPPQPPKPAPTTGYHIPSKPLVDLVDAPPTPQTLLSPGRSHLLILDQPGLPPIADLAERELRLAGYRIRPGNNGPSRAPYFTKITVEALGDTVGRVITGLPPGARIRNVAWSPDGSRFAFTVADDHDIELWAAERDHDQTRRIIRQPLNAALTVPYRWLSDSKSLIAAIVPEARGPEPPEPKVPPGPVVQETTGKPAPARTYQDLLQNSHDEDLFDYYGTAQLIRVDLGGKRKRLGAPAMIDDFDPSPDGSYLIVDILHRPYSYLVPADRFPHREEIWDADGNLVHTVADVPLQEGVPVAFGSVPVGPRNVSWRADAPATVSWVEAQDGGDASKEAAVRDKIFLLTAPFKGDPATLISLSLRAGGIDWGTDDLAVVNEWWWKTRREKTWLVKPGKPGSEPVLLFDRSFEDRYNDPGSFVTRPDDRGRDVLFASAGDAALYLIGEGASPEGNRPFLDRYTLADKSTQRVWRCEGKVYERPLDLLDPGARRLLTRRETPEDPPNLYLRDLGDSSLVEITRFPYPYPQLKGFTKELIHYQRADGVKLSGTLYLPAGYKPEQGPLPMLMWAYPQEFKSADAAGQVTDSPYRFDRITGLSPLVWLTEGYAVLDDPKLPIIGEGKAEPNDTYVSQLVAGAEAAVKAVVDRGVADPERIAIGGHSYGAFMVANLLAHSNLFRAGIARSGAYNRTLTPFGFQAEERTYWQAPDVYNAMSPFMHADQVSVPILLIHGEADNNSGTFPIQSERFFDALKGLGKTARLVLLPYESHGYRARESVLDVLWETETWLNTYVKGAAPRPRSGVGDKGGEGSSGDSR